VVIVHALRNALIPVVTVIGLSVSGLLAGAILTETIFAWPGVGHWLVESDRAAGLSGVADGDAADRGAGDPGESGR
jgi:ABC-type dipeptide/oligopeptide/nickel transport system permease component